MDKKSTQDSEIRGAVCWGHLRHARCAYDVVSFLSRLTRLYWLVIQTKEKRPGIAPRALGWIWGYGLFGWVRLRYQGDDHLKGRHGRQLKLMCAC